MLTKEYIYEDAESAYLIEDYRIGHSILRLKSVERSEPNEIRFEAVQYLELPRKLDGLKISIEKDPDKIELLKGRLGGVPIFNLFVIETKYTSFYVVAAFVKLN